MNKKLKNIIKNKYFKIISLIILGIFILQQSYAIYVDVYNFGQFKKAKLILENISIDDYKFYTLKKFNEKYKADIKPVKNCYYISNDNGKEKYIFGMKLESILFKIRYLSFYYTYPSYNLEIKPLCVMGGECIKDIKFKRFKETISNPCQD